MSPDGQSLLLGGVARPVAHGARDPGKLPAKTANLAHAITGGKAATDVCDCCGQPLRVQVLQGYRSGRPIYRRLCLRCAVEVPASGVAFPEHRSRLRLSTLLALAGVVLGVIGIAGDFLAPGSHPGFGWYQRVGAGIGALLVFTGFLMRAEAIGLGGAMLFAASLCADWFGLTHGPGIGWKQQVMLGMGMACIGIAVLARFRAAAARRLALVRWGGADGGGDPQAAHGT